MYILGISAYYHDAAAVLLKNSEIIAAAQEERFTRIKNDSSFPENAVKYCLQEAGISGSEIRAVVYYDKPFTTFERLLETYLTFAPRGFKSFIKSVPLWIHEKLFIKSTLQRELTRALGSSFKNRIFFSQHHLSHAASAFYPSPFQEAAILTIDGVGEWATATISLGQGNKIKLLRQMNFPHSWGLFYSAMTQFLGFKVNSGEYKLMGLAPYGDPESEQTRNFCKLIEKSLLKVHSDGSLTLNMDYFSFATSDVMIPTNRWEQLFNISARTPESLITQEQANLAWAAQHTLENGVFKLALETRRITQSKNLVLAGGVALNCVANGKIVAEEVFENVWIQPAANDAGGALGAAYAFLHLGLSVPRTKSENGDQMKGSYLGPAFSNSQIKDRLQKYKFPFQEFDREEALCEEAAKHLKSGKILAWFQGRMEWGPRSLGNRSILSAAVAVDARRKLNLKVKFRESFRPFAPIVPAEDAAKYFLCKTESPYMLLTAKIKEDFRLPPADKNLVFSDRLDHKSSVFPAISHYDYSARLQTVSKETNSSLHTLLKSYKQMTSHPILVNTSFNVRGQPIVCTPEEAFECFLATDIDVLVVGLFMYEKQKMNAEEVASFRQSFGKINLD